MSGEFSGEYTDCALCFRLHRMKPTIAATTTSTPQTTPTTIPAMAPPLMPPDLFFEWPLASAAAVDEAEAEAVGEAEDCAAVDVVDADCVELLDVNEDETSEELVAVVDDVLDSMEEVEFACVDVATEVSKVDDCASVVDTAVEELRV